MAQFVNAKEDLVKEAIDGLLACSGGALTRLDGFPHIQEVYLRAWYKLRLAQSSGGGSGHVPSLAVAVGPGSFSAHDFGEVFASPSDTTGRGVFVSP